MRLSTIRRIVVPGRNGKPVWREISQNYLPKGGRKFSFELKGFLTICGFISLAFYGFLQAQYNPKSIYGRVYDKIAMYTLITTEQSASHETAEAAYAVNDAAKIV